MGSKERTERLQQVYGASDQGSLEKAYDEWAEHYDEDLTAFGYKNPAVAAGLIGRHVAKEASILDAGCGTGMLGEVLGWLGYDNLHGIDLSDGMLAQARTKGAYQELRKMALGGKLDFPENHFGAVISFGVLTAGHAPPESLDEMIRITRPGGHLIFSLSNLVYEPLKFKDKLEGLGIEGLWHELERTSFFPVMPGSGAENHVESAVFVFQKLAR
ncbi:class I SAM-dependent DNA methyltransferase [Aestuariispira insulae]|uniref:Methyltransferase family protein n=1 Tax=Aestuariispira insulae TaxID=1461337 RepID=A0A3D9HMM3_9PROT|nr:class I SAM-dependent methyltransferase [Aestuariispira insulae]RED50757.1 methyltransferase family protein [Aestuariispira insulae]